MTDFFNNIQCYKFKSTVDSDNTIKVEITLPSVLEANRQTQEFLDYIHRLYTKNINEGLNSVLLSEIVTFLLDVENKGYPQRIFIDKLVRLTDLKESKKYHSIILEGLATSISITQYREKTK